MYSASIVLKAICVCSFELQQRGQPINIIKYPDRDLTEIGS